jgi:hypothetical protein
VTFRTFIRVMIIQLCLNVTCTCRTPLNGMRRLFARFSLSCQDMAGWRSRYFKTAIFCWLHFACAAVLILFQLVHEKQGRRVFCGGLVPGSYQIAHEKLNFFVWIP